jgi:hypothetical protein
MIPGSVVELTMLPGWNGRSSHDWDASVELEGRIAGRYALLLSQQSRRHGSSSLTLF